MQHLPRQCKGLDMIVIRVASIISATKPIMELTYMIVQLTVEIILYNNHLIYTDYS